MDDEQRATCAEYEVVGEPPVKGSKFLTAAATASRSPIQGMRGSSEGNASGWHIWGGDYSSEPDFFRPVLLHELLELFPEANKYLALPAFWHFAIGQAGRTEFDVWCDPVLEGSHPTVAEQHRIDEAWTKEIERRVRKYERDPTGLIDGAEFLPKLGRGERP